MSRGIKFRCYETCDNGEPYNMVFSDDEGGLLEFFTMTNTSEYLMQLTGLTDKKGVDIYEGDIISFSNGTLSQDVNGDIPCPNGSPMRYSKNENLIREVIYEKSSFRINNGNPLGSAYLSSDEIEIIGNIHQNSDLLK